VPASAAAATAAVALHEAGDQGGECAEGRWRKEMRLVVACCREVSCIDDAVIN